MFDASQIFVVPGHIFGFVFCFCKSYDKLTCGVQRHEASHDSLQDPLLGYGDPYGGQAPPDVHAGQRAAPPAESIASKATSVLTASLLPPGPMLPLIHVMQKYACILQYT